MRLLTALLLGFLAIGAPGCSFHSNAWPGRGHNLTGVWTGDAPGIPSSAWPARATDQLQELISLTPEVLTMRVPQSRVEDGRVVQENVTTPVMRVVHAGVYGRGIVREFAPSLAGTAVDENDPVGRMYSGLQFVSYRPDPGPPSDFDLESDQAQRWHRRLIYRRLGFRPGSSDTWVLATHGTLMRIMEPAGPLRRGLVVHLSSLGGLAYEQAVINRLLARGWAVLRVNASTARRDEEPFEIDPDSDMADSGAALARTVDNRIAEIAYAVEATLAYLDETRPQGARQPVVVMGYSAGALAAPAVAALIKDRVEAVVLTGGGANVLDISQRSTLTNGGIVLDWPRGTRPTDQARQRLYDSYLSRVALDPYKTAPLLNDVPVLMLHAMLDNIVPASAGELLYERLGRPERVSFTLGHRGLFWRLPAEAAWVAEWVDRTVPVKRAGSIPAEAPHHDVP